MPLQKRLNYNSVFDPGNAAILFPHKNPLFAQTRQRHFDGQIRSILQFHLLWRPSLVVRHMDLFNNIPLMRFMCSDEAGLLCEHGMLRVICPNEDNFQNIFHDWAFSKSGQHFHHLDSGQQAS